MSDHDIMLRISYSWLHFSRHRGRIYRPISSLMMDVDSPPRAAAGSSALNLNIIRIKRKATEAPLTSLGQYPTACLAMPLSRI
jgi:hypothetical protein